MKLMTIRALFVLLLTIPALVAHEGHAGKKATIIGQVVDTACYLGHDSKGDKHLDCAQACAREGIPLAILDAKSGMLYLPIAMDHKNVNPKLMPYVEKKVKVTGVVYTKNGMRGIVIDKLEAAE